MPETLPPVVLHYQRTTPAIDPVAKYHAHRTLRVLGPLCTFLGASCALPTSVYVVNHPDDWPAIIPVLFFGFLIGSGVTYWVCGARIRGDSRGAALLALVLACSHLAFFLMWMVISFMAMVAGEWIALMPFIFAGLFAVGLMDLVRHLRRCVRSFTLLLNAA